MMGPGGVRAQDSGHLAAAHGGRSCLARASPSLGAGLEGKEFQREGCHEWRRREQKLQNRLEGTSERTSLPPWRDLFFGGKLAGSFHLCNDFHKTKRDRPGDAWSLALGQKGLADRPLALPFGKVCDLGPRGQFELTGGSRDGRGGKAAGQH